tara:strand:- start:676 stop:1179 length:504 start_codon:yes stop_codon:yes gene_type:complete
MIRKQKKFLDVILAMSNDYFFAKNSWDDMKWTGSDDKLLFKALTMYDNTILLCGPRTAETMPLLKHRNLRVVRTQTDGYFTANGLLYREMKFKDLPKDKNLIGAKLIGGPSLVESAINAGYVRSAYISVINEKLNSGYGKELYQRHFQFCRYKELQFGKAKLRKYKL